MKKALSIVIALVLATSLVGCGGTVASTAPSPGTQSEATASPAPVGSGTLGDYAVTIVGYALTKDYEGKPAVVITYNWTNNSEETANFAFALGAQVFQNSIECETAIIMDGSVYSADNYMKDIKPGASLDVQLAYVLQDSTNPIDVEVTELINFNDDNMITQTFDITK